MKILSKILLVWQVVRHNLRIVFANKFIYFLIAAIAFFLLVIGIMLFSSVNPQAEEIYDTIIFPGILIIFYPVIYSIQNDKDTRMLEIIFGVPNYRYKIYLVRFLITMVILAGFLILMSAFTVFAIYRFPIMRMVIQLMFPLFFLSGMAFLFSTLVKNGNGAAVIMVIIGLIFLFMQEPLEYSKWNVFLNPFNTPSDMSLNVWRNVVTQNRLMLSIAGIVALLWSLINLQKREKFVQ